MSNNELRKNILRTAVILLLLALVAYNLYSGLVIKKIGIPGLVEIEFGKEAGSDIVSTSTVPITEPTLRSVTTSDSIAGEWSGTVYTKTNKSVEIDLFVEPDCKIDNVCGTVTGSAGCSGKLVLTEIEGNTFVFVERDVAGPAYCSNLSEATVRLKLNGNLSWSLRNKAPSGKQIATDGILRRL